MNEYLFNSGTRRKTVGAFLLLCLLLMSVTLTASAYWGRNGRFIPYENNPIILPGAFGEWDGTIFEPYVLYIDGMYHLFHTTLKESFGTPGGIGYATSIDGLNWTRPVDEPIFTADGTGFDAYMVSAPTVLKEGNTWVMYYAGKSAPPSHPNGLVVGRATAPAPEGPWTRLDDPVMLTGQPGEWDMGFVFPDTVMPVDNGYMMYYSGGANFLTRVDFMVGLAFSTDGLTWEKYNNPNTRRSPFAFSDSVLKPGDTGSWDDDYAWSPSVIQSDNMWEMFYTAVGTNNLGAVGYARSTDGIHWQKSRTNPVLTVADDPVYGNLIELQSVVDVPGKRMLFYDYGVGGQGLGVAVEMFPFRATYTGSLTEITYDREECNIQGMQSSRLDLSGWATYMGRIDVVLENCFDPATGTFNEGIFTFISTGDDDGTVYGVYDGQIVGAEFAVTYEVTGGTGCFEGATGSGAGSGPILDPVTFELESTLEGVLSIKDCE